MSFEKMTLTQRVQAANIDCMRHPEYSRLSGCMMMGKSEVVPEGATVQVDAIEVATGRKVRVGVKVPTAMTNGRDKYYGEAMIKDMTRKQLRYLVLHENFHVGLKHCTLYKEASQKYPQLCNIAQDFVCNGTIEELDPDFKFVERPTNPEPLVDPKYQGWSFPQVFNDLFKQAKEEAEKRKGKVKGKGKGKGEKGDGDPMDGDGDPMDGDGFGETMDDHVRDQFDEDKPGAGGKSEAQQVEQMVDDANRQGEILSKRMRGDGAGGRDILETAKERQTDWREPLREFIQSVSVGDDQSRFCPPNKRMLASGFVMPSHFTENVGGIIIACDTSGSMHPYYPTVFGEVARICQDVKPEWVRMLWWDTQVCADQQFEAKDYDQIATQLAPAGGGGTVVTCVQQYIKDKEIKGAVAIIYLTDGYIEDEYEMPEIPALWGIVENESFVPKRGKVVRITV